MSEPDRTDSATRPILIVRCPTWREFAESFIDDLVSGGMYVANADPLPPLQAVVVQLLLPEATEIVLSARVVQVVSKAQAEQLGKIPGLALELLDLDAERKRQVVQLIEFARWQGSSDDPNASFSRTMLELTPSLQPHELALRLSQLPPPQTRAESRPATQTARRDSQSSLPAQRASNRPTVAPGSYAPPSQEQNVAASTPRPSNMPAAHSGMSPTRPASSQSLPAHAPRPRGESTRAMPAAQPQTQPQPPRPRSQSSQAMPAAQPPRPRSQSTQAMPAAQPQTQPQPPRPRSQSTQAMPAVQIRPRPETQTSQTMPTPPRDAYARRQSGQTLTPPLDAHVRRQSGQILAPREAEMPAPSQPAPASAAMPSGVAPAKPTDQVRLKLVLTNVAHKHYDAALAVTSEMLADNPGDPQALRWQAMCCARLALQRGETQVARAHYEQLLQVDPNHREAREFIRVHERDRKLSSLPFGRYFTKKK